MKVIIHFVNWNWQDRAYLFPEKLIPEFIERLKVLPKKKNGYDWEHNGTWEWFCDNRTDTKGIEDADLFLDYSEPYECVKDWEDDYKS